LQPGERQKLSYAPPIRRKREVRKKDLAIVVLFLAGVVVFVKWQNIQDLYTTMHAYLWQREAMAEEWNTGHVACDDGGTIYVSAPWKHMKEAREIPQLHSPAKATVFLHRRKLSTTGERLVVIETDAFKASGMASRTAGFHCHSIVPGTLTVPWREPRVGGSQELTVRLNMLDRFTVYSGQADPTDESHFTISYTVNGEVGTIDGWLRDDDHIELRPRVGSVVHENRWDYWDPQGRSY